MQDDYSYRREINSSLRPRKRKRITVQLMTFSIACIIFLLTSLYCYRGGGRKPPSAFVEREREAQRYNKRVTHTQIYSDRTCI